MKSPVPNGEYWENESVFDDGAEDAKDTRYDELVDRVQPEITSFPHFVVEKLFAFYKFTTEGVYIE